jgi:adenylosuccinate synthase
MATSFPPSVVASDVPELTPFIQDTSELLESVLAAGDRVLIEGTQGFGLSPLHGNSWPKATGRDTTAAAFLSEAGVSPLHVDDVVLVIRSFEIRVAGNSGPLAHETTWDELSRLRGAFIEPEETSVTRRVRRVGHFDPEIVRRAIVANAPTRIALNHLDYVDPQPATAAKALSAKARSFVDFVEDAIKREIDLVGTGPDSTIYTRERAHGRAA